VDFDGAFSTDGEELEDTVLEDTVACVPDCGYAQTSTEHPASHLAPHLASHLASHPVSLFTHYVITSLDLRGRLS